MHTCCLVSPSHTDTSYIELGPALMTSFILITFKELISKCSHILRYWGIGFQHRGYHSAHNNHDLLMNMLSEVWMGHVRVIRYLGKGNKRSTNSMTLGALGVTESCSLVLLDTQTWMWSLVTIFFPQSLRGVNMRGQLSRERDSIQDQWSAEAAPRLFRKLGPTEGVSGGNCR